MPRRATATAPAPQQQQQQIEPNPMQRVMLQAPLDDHLCLGTAKATGKSFGIVLLVLRDCQLLKENYHCLITRSTFQGLQEIQTLLYKYLTTAHPGTTWNAGESMFRIGGKAAPFGTIELAYRANSPLEQIRALNRLQGRSKSTLIHDECGNDSSPDFFDQLQGVLRGPKDVPTRSIFLANPGGPGHVWLRQRFAIPAGLPEAMQPRRFWSDEYQRHCVFLTANASINPAIDWERYRREVQLMAGGDPALEAALIEGRWDLDLGGAYLAHCWAPARQRYAIRPGDHNLRDHHPRPFVSMDWGTASPSAAYLFVPSPPGIDAPRGTLLMADEWYCCSSTIGGNRDWGKGSHMSSAEQAQSMIEWLRRWGLRPGDVPVIADDAVFANNGSTRGRPEADPRREGQNPHGGGAEPAQEPYGRRPQGSRPALAAVVSGLRRLGGHRPGDSKASPRS
jgi:hypothetical protein